MTECNWVVKASLPIRIVCCARTALTVRSELAHALVGSDTLDVVGDYFGVGNETLRSQLKPVFLKTRHQLPDRTVSTWPAWIGRIRGVK